MTILSHFMSSGILYEMKGISNPYMVLLARLFDKKSIEGFDWRAGASTNPYELGAVA